MSDQDETNDTTDPGAELSDQLAVGGDEEFVVTEPKKPVNGSTVVLLGLVIAGGAALYFMHWKSGPSKAMAEPAAQQAQLTIEKFLSGGAGNVRAMEEVLKNTEKVVEQFEKYPSVNQVPVDQLAGNPFKLDGQTPKEDLSANAMKKQREAERAEVLKAVQALQLQTVMHSTGTKACMINNTLYREGQTVETFTIEKISASGVVVRSGTYRFELKMQR